MSAIAASAVMFVLLVPNVTGDNLPLYPPEVQVAIALERTLRREFGEPSADRRRGRLVNRQPRRRCAW